MWPPANLLQRPYGPSPVAAQLPQELEWFRSNVLAVLPIARKQSETEYALTASEEALVTMSFSEWRLQRAAGTYSCEQMAIALSKRAQYMQHVQRLNHFMYWDCFDWVAVVLAKARAFDAAAAGSERDRVCPRARVR